MQVHANEFEITDHLVRTLVDSQFPAYSTLPLDEIDSSGSTNRCFRLGCELVVRIPRQAGGGVTLLKEAQWASAIARALTVQSPAVVGIGRPTPPLTEYWTISRWIPGATLAHSDSDRTTSDSRRSIAVALADQIRRVREMPVEPGLRFSTQLQSYRGMPLVHHSGAFLEALHRCRSLPDLDVGLDAARQIWLATADIRGTSHTDSPRWFHGDLVGENLLVRESRLEAIIDLGNVGIGDPAVDLHGAWSIFDAGDRDVFRDQVGAADDEWQRGRAWAIAISVGSLSYYWDSMPARVADRRVMLEAAIAGP